MRVYEYMNTQTFVLSPHHGGGAPGLPGQAAAAPQPSAHTGNPMPPAATPAKPGAVETSTAAGDQVIQTLSFDELPLPDAIRQLAKLAGLNIAN